MLGRAQTPRALPALLLLLLALARPGTAAPKLKFDEDGTFKARHSACGTTIWRVLWLDGAGSADGGGAAAVAAGTAQHAAGGVLRRPKQPVISRGWRLLCPYPCCRL